ncbi:MAG TPA: potassium channel family protein, partial [Acidimicrobiales bacterium]|nr:potassium channel family protein [Acidimicrobiales bacterium]
MTEPFRRVWLGVLALLLILLGASAGYVALGFSLLDAVYQTVTTITTVGFREVQPLSDTGKLYTIAVILVGFGTAFYTMSALIEALIEGHVTKLMERRRMEKRIA